MVNGDTVMWMGVGCAAKGTGVSVREINAAERTANADERRLAIRATVKAFIADGPKLFGATLKAVRLAVDDRVTADDIHDAARRERVMDVCGTLGPVLAA